MDYRSYENILSNCILRKIVMDEIWVFIHFIFLSKLEIDKIKQI